MESPEQFLIIFPYTCSECGQRIQPPKRGAIAKVCSDRCRKRKQRRSQRGKNGIVNDGT